MSWVLNLFLCSMNESCRSLAKCIPDLFNFQLASFYLIMFQKHRRKDDPRKKNFEKNAVNRGFLKLPRLSSDTPRCPRKNALNRGVENRGSKKTRLPSVSPRYYKLRLVAVLWNAVIMCITAVVEVVVS